MLASFADMSSATTVGSKLLAFRTLRVIRFLRESSLHRIIKAGYKFIPAVLGVCVAVLLVILVYAIIGTQVRSRIVGLTAVAVVCRVLHAALGAIYATCMLRVTSMSHLCRTQALRTGAADHSFGDLSDGIFTLFMVGTVAPSLY